MMCGLWVWLLKKMVVAPVKPLEKHAFCHLNTIGYLRKCLAVSQNMGNCLLIAMTAMTKPNYSTTLIQCNQEIGIILKFIIEWYGTA
jgi:hypothetical protein